MTSSTLIPLMNHHRNGFSQSSNRYSIHDHGQGYRTYIYEFDLIDYEPEQITVLLDKSNRLRIRAYRPICHEFYREYNLGGSDVEARLVRNTIDMHGHLRVDVNVYPRQYNTTSNNNTNNNDNILTFDLQGYQSKNINVRINENGLLKVHAQHIDDQVGHQITREYYRQYQLAKNTNPNQIRAKIDENQLLTIELPQSLPKIKQSWLPYSEKTYPIDYKKKPCEKSRCCTVM